MKEYQDRFEKKIRENEIAFWNTGKRNLDKVISMRPDSVADRSKHR